MFRHFRLHLLRTTELLEWIRTFVFELATQSTKHLHVQAVAELLAGISASNGLTNKKPVAYLLL